MTRKEVENVVRTKLNKVGEGRYEKTKGSKFFELTIKNDSFEVFIFDSKDNKIIIKTKQLSKEV